MKSRLLRASLIACMALVAASCNESEEYANVYDVKCSPYEPSVCINETQYYVCVDSFPTIVTCNSGLVCIDNNGRPGCFEKTQSNPCRNGIIDEDEQCDGANLNGKTCSTEIEGTSGNLSCNGDCTLNTENCHVVTETPECGNGVLESGEQCDGQSLGGKTCSDIVEGTEGELACNGQCQFNTDDCRIMETKPACGNGQIEDGEQCDADNFNGKICDDIIKGTRGILECDESCHIDSTQCTVVVRDPECGNGEINPGEQCDGDNLNNKTCNDVIRGTVGILECNDVCLFDFSDCHVSSPESECGNGQIEDGEQCDGTNFNGKTCGDLVEGTEGELRCDSQCLFVLQGCEPPDVPSECGNGIIEAGEQCDGTNFNGKVCADLITGTEGTLSCNEFCQFIVTGCEVPAVEPECGNGVIEAGEQCDGINLNNMVCADFVTGTEGMLSCDEQCRFDVTGCEVPVIEPECGNGIAENGEQCDVSDLNGKSCADLVAGTEGNLLCDDSCSFITDDCKVPVVEPECGNGIVEAGEQCDGYDFNDTTCASLIAESQGELSCDSACRFDTTACLVVIPECLTNDDCDSDLICEEQHCVEPPPECFTDENCRGDYICVNHKCVEPEPECLTDEDCGMNMACVEKKCVEKQFPEVVKCQPLTISGTNACERTGSGTSMVLRGDVLTLDKTYEGGSVVIQNGMIVYVGCEPDMTNATVITCPNSVISPGLINAHDHITYSNQPPKNWGVERFDHRLDWRMGKYNHSKQNANNSSNNDSAELRQLMAGVTSVFGSGKLNGLLRNIDKEAVGNVASPTYQTFPLGDSTFQSYASSCSNYTNIKTADGYYGPHIGEGINDTALLEFKCLSTDGNVDLFNDKLSVIHGVSATPQVIAMMANRRSKLIWSPRTNIALYGDTANVTIYDNYGITIALGTDWTPSGSPNLLREFACVDFLNTYYYNNHFNDYEIWLMGTYNGAVAFGLESVIGAIKVGLIADIAIYHKTDGRQAHRAVIGASNSDVNLVMIQGKILLGDENIVPNASNCAVDDVCGSSKRICPDGNNTYATIKNNAKYDGVHNLFFCGEPKDEPTCIPMRTRPEDTTNQSTTLYDGNYSDSFSAPDDIDGDGIPNDVDNCPLIFNPIRPMAGKVQTDSDGDSFGDVCDSYPLCTANDNTCPTYNARDYDNDGIDNNIDNCTEVYNPDQKDTDNDGKGDLCDDCPEDYNPGNARCPIHGDPLKVSKANEIVTSSCPDATKTCEGTQEILVSGLVTAIAKDGGFFIQDDSSAPFSGIHVDSTTIPNLNDLVTVQGIAGRYYGMAQIRDAIIVSTQGIDLYLPPVELTISELTQNNLGYTGMLIQINNATVQASDNQASYNMYLIKDTSNATLYIDDFNWIASPKPTQGTVYESIRGIYVYDFSKFKIAPRFASDLVILPAP